MEYRSDDKIGRRIETLRGDLPQRELALAVGMEPTALNKAIAGKRRLNLNEIVSIASYLGVEPESLIAEDGPVFVMRAGNDDDAVCSAVEECSNVVEDFLIFESLVGRS
jgi:transcriptional regulator with XRE-family HTH domain